MWRVLLSLWLKARTSIISVKAKGAPKARVMVRKGRSLTPDMGASMQGRVNVMLPIVSTPYCSLCLIMCQIIGDRLKKGCSRRVYSVL